MVSVPNQPKTKPRNVRIDDELWAEAQATASASGSNISEVIRAFLRSYVERNRARNSPREVPAELRDLLKRYEIAENSVADWSTEIAFAHMWRSKLPWPAGGTYEAEVPNGYDDEMVARKATVRAVMTLVDAGRSVLERAESFEMLPVSSNDQPNLYRVTLVDRGQWEFCDK